MSQTILFVCATGIATSTAVTEKVMEYCKEHGLNVNYSQTNVASLPGNTDGVALVVSTTKVPYELDVPVVNGLPIITGIGEEKVLAQIVSILKKQLIIINFNPLHQALTRGALSPEKEVYYERYRAYPL
ncbi:PTS system transporter subunit IIB [Escherichia coli]|uniref:PTS system transporter subunit IIB n=41 Tax=Pseudomonadota TaxID=1224 RepID=A0A376VCC8_ECOLX|nr:PTS system transporter subunit IIB [Escherichia coli]STJ08769.1 PTS system transporter subunit IIB [Escherichia coli]